MTLRNSIHISTIHIVAIIVIIHYIIIEYRGFGLKASIRQCFARDFGI
ncbi:CLUMA_CG015013, isoform A [Clunio marinus]|uniref:CLUMA_CG015013, isoform A n=1 Tax=Clunio marinus TaxID=568069 RepID=A0A1J1INJ5_9DIPT|nr:CLUMA_CG015013, isoform A [Clunio marinus]